MTDAELLSFHRSLVATPSVSGDEGPIADLVAAFLADRGVSVRRFHDNIWAILGEVGPILCLNSHLDTVPPAPGWTLPPWTPTLREGRVHGLGSNDAKAPAAAMTAAFLRVKAGGGLPGARLALALVACEETGGDGAEILVPEMQRLGLAPAAAVIGEPTGLDVSVAQKGLLMLELRETGMACHAAHGRALGARNALSLLARDLVDLEAADLGPDHPVLGPVTLEPTTAQGGTARNVIPAAASCTLDVRTNPGESHEVLVERLRKSVSGELAVYIDRLVPCDVDPADPLVRAALEARPGAVAFGSRAVSDWVYFRDVPSIKAGPGRTERSHTPDEYVLESEVLDGARFYEALARGWAAGATGQGRAP
jgi:acetylornithine deacetylase